MKNQYFGNIHDYIKYCLLRQLSDRGNINMSICWMLTKSDDTRDGQGLEYLHNPVAWRHYDPPLFDCLRAAVLDRKVRSIRSIEQSGFLPSTLFYSRLLTDDHDERQVYFDGFLDFARDKDLVFFDPDNGLEIKSVKYGRKGSSRYLFLREVSQTYSAGNSLLVYQHFPRKPREPFIKDIASSLVWETDSDLVYVFHNTRVAFFLVPQKDEIGRFADGASRVRRKLGYLLQTRRFMA